jgi:hypothetical protein
MLLSNKLNGSESMTIEPAIRAGSDHLLVLIGINIEAVINGVIP